MTGRDQTASYSPAGLPGMLAPRFVSESQIDPTSVLKLLSATRKEERQEGKRENSEREGRESVRWRFEGGNELPASTTLVMTRLPCLSLSSLRRSFPSAIPKQWLHFKLAA